MRRMVRIVLALLAGLLALHDPVHAAQGGSPNRATAPQAAQDGKAAAQAYFTDVELVSHQGKTMRLYSDLLQGKVVVINSFYGTCTGSCPIIMNTMAKIQEALGDRLGKEVSLISLTVDPVTDTPLRLKEYAERIGAKPGWYLLGGKKGNVELALRKLGQEVKRKEQHPNIVIIGNERTRLWKKVMALAPTETLIPIVEGVLQDK